MTNYRVSGENRQVGAIGIFERFEITVQATDETQAKDIAREARYDAGFEHVHIKSAEEVE